jgi:hypothetical protein
MTSPSDRRDGARAPRLPVRFRPLGVRVAVVVLGAALLGTATAIWIAFPDDVRAAFTFAERLTLLAIGVAAVAIGHALARSRVDADDAGLTVVNGYRARRFDWNQVVAVSLRPGSPWAVLDLSDGTSQAAMGIQGSDGVRARRQTRELRALVEAHAGQEPETRSGGDDASNGHGPDAD